MNDIILIILWYTLYVIWKFFKNLQSIYNLQIRRRSRFFRIMTTAIIIIDPSFDLYDCALGSLVIIEIRKQNRFLINDKNLDVYTILKTNAILYSTTREIEKYFTVELFDVIVKCLLTRLYQLLNQNIFLLVAKV